MCLEKIGTCVQNMLTNLGSIIIMIREGLYDNTRYCIIVIDNLELHNVMTIYCISHFWLTKVKNWLFGHYRTLTYFLGKIILR